MFLLSLHYPSPLRLAELRTCDLRMYARAAHKPHGEVVIVAIDDKSIVELGRWPWPRTVLARLSDALKSYKAAVVGFDMVFSERDYADRQPQEPPGRVADNPARAGGGDETFAQSIRAHGNSFVGYPLQVTTGADGGLSPGFVTEIDNPPPRTYTSVELADPLLKPPVTDAVAYLPNLSIINRAARGSGFFNAPADGDGIFRSELMVIRFGKLYCEPFVLALASAYLHEEPTSVRLGKFGVERVALGTIDIPVDDQGRMLVNFRGPARTFPYYSASDVIAHRVPDWALADKIVLVGATAFGVGDRLSTPMGADFPGVEVHANAIDNILSGDFIQRSDLTVFLELMAALLMGVAISAAVAYLPASWSALTCAAMICGYFGVAQYLLVNDGLLVGVLFPMLTTFVTYAGLTSYRLYLTEERAKRSLARAVGEGG